MGRTVWKIDRLHNEDMLYEVQNNAKKYKIYNSSNIKLAQGRAKRQHIIYIFHTLSGTTSEKKSILCA